MRLTITLFASLLAATAPITMAADRPNIVFMLSDDQGWNGLSVAMHPNYSASKGSVFHTPNLEKLASQGMRFSAAYSPAPVCSPTRISIQTGKSPARLHWTKAAPPEDGHKMTEPNLVKQISPDEITIAEILREAGYATAHFGKWHISGGGPARHGYDESDGDTGNEHAFLFEDPNPVDIFGMADKAAAFMETNSKAQKPFFIQLSWNALHAPENSLKATAAKYEHLSKDGNSRLASAAAITEDLDTGVGRVLASIDRLGLAKNTIVIYMSDNGAGVGRIDGLHGGKGSLWEGGIRVPLIIRGPGITPNSWSHVPVVGYDFYPTFAEWAKVSPDKLPKDIEGGSIVGLLANPENGSVKRAREPLFFHFPHSHRGDGPHSSVLLGNLKLLKFYEDDSVKLFDISKDIQEQHDISREFPKETARLHKTLISYLSEVNAQYASLNPNYDPSVPPPTPARRERGRRPGRTTAPENGAARNSKKNDAKE